MGVCMSRIFFCLVGNCLKGSASDDDLSILRDGDGTWESPSAEQIGERRGAAGDLHLHHHHHHHHHLVQGQRQSPSPNVRPPVPQLTAEEQLKIANRIALIQRLPQGVFENESDKTRECAICMIEFEKGDSVRYMPCIHMYHVQCIDDWLMRNLNCPTCMESVDNAMYYTYESD